MMDEREMRNNLEKEGEDFVKLPEEWFSILSKIQYSWDNVEIPTEDNRIKISLGKQFVYISRKDVLDAKYSNHAQVPTQVLRLVLSEDGRSIKGVTEDDKILASDTLGLLKDVPFFAHLISRFGLSVDRIPEEDLSAMFEKQNVGVREKVAVREWFAARAAEAPMRNLLRLADIQNKSKNVRQGSVQFLKRGEASEYLLTLGAGPCVIIGGSNLETGEHGLTHIDAISDSKSLVDSLVGRVGKGKYFVLGGDASSLDQLLQIKNELETLDITVTTWDCLNEEKSVAIDGKTGELFDLITFAPKLFGPRLP